jgi:iron complex outermembrane receptor protein
MKKLACVCALAIAMDLFSSGATAQSAAPSAGVVGDGGGLEEIVVTAQRRQESIQKSSLVIQAVSGTELESAGVTQVKDLNAPAARQHKSSSAVWGTCPPTSKPIPA